MTDEGREKTKDEKSVRRPSDSDVISGERSCFVHREKQKNV